MDVYKKRARWACPYNCFLHGNTSKTRQTLFRSGHSSSFVPSITEWFSASSTFLDWVDIIQCYLFGRKKRGLWPGLGGIRWLTRFSYLALFLPNKIEVKRAEQLFSPCGEEPPPRTPSITRSQPLVLQIFNFQSSGYAIKGWVECQGKVVLMLRFNSQIRLWRLKER